MLEQPILITAAMLVGSFGVALCALLVAQRVEQKSARRNRLFLGDDDRNLIYLFEGQRLVNATSRARHVLNTAQDAEDDWTHFLAVFGAHFPDLGARLKSLRKQGMFRIESSSRGTCIVAEWKNGLTKITVIEPEASNGAEIIDRYTLSALEQELTTLRGIADNTSVPVWREKDGTIIWANRVYLDLADQDAPEGAIPMWPPRRLFDLADESENSGNTRCKLIPHENGTTDRPDRWYDCQCIHDDDQTVITAVPVTNLVKAKSDLSAFIQTLTKTFASLPIALAIFDDKRQLVLFNPALADLTKLPAEFLANKPTLPSFLDRLRERQLLPEPKNYASWRRKLAALEAAAESGQFEDTWHIPTGQILQITGRPHPGNSLAFQIEDITAELSLSRRYRAQVDTGQAVIDALDEAVAVFAANGTLILTNTAYDSLWHPDQTATNQPVRNISILDATREWHSKCAPSPLWGDVRDFVGAMTERAEWTGEVRMWDGRHLQCRFLPLGGGITFVGFSVSLDIASSKRPPSLQIEASNG